MLKTDDKTYLLANTNFKNVQISLSYGQLPTYIWRYVILLLLLQAQLTITKQK